MLRRHQESGAKVELDKAKVLGHLVPVAAASFSPAFCRVLQAQGKVELFGSAQEQAPNAAQPAADAAPP